MKAVSVVAAFPVEHTVKIESVQGTLVVGVVLVLYVIPVILAGSEIYGQTFCTEEDELVS